jgi:hypothetical protein
MLERLDAHLKGEQFYSGGCLLGRTAAVGFGLLWFAVVGAARAAGAP